MFPITRPALWPSHLKIWWDNRHERKQNFFRKISGVIHIGANTGQEREAYAAFDLDVIWIEPIPDVFERLTANLAGFPKQKAYRFLVTEQDDREYTFHISNNEKASSSIYPLAENRGMWPEIVYTDTIKLRSITLSTFVTQECIDLDRFQALVLDTQGSELLVLKGGADVLKRFRFIRLEVSDFEFYKGCSLLPEVNGFMQMAGFRELGRETLQSLPGVGTYYDITYARR